MCVSTYCCASSGVPIFQDGRIWRFMVETRVHFVWARPSTPESQGPDSSTDKKEKGAPKLPRAGLQTHRRGTRCDRHLGARQRLQEFKLVTRFCILALRPVRQSATVGLPEPWLSISRR